MTDVQHTPFADLAPALLYALLRLRVDVFVVEQACAYPELDGRDVEVSTVHFWTADADGPTAYLRLLDDVTELRIGRVCTRADARGCGLAAELISAAVTAAGDRDVVLDAQSHLSGWYTGFGFAADGADFTEDGIAHRPMRRAGRDG